MRIETVEVTDASYVAVVMRGEHGYYTLGKPASLTHWANKLSDLTGYKAEYLVSTLLAALATQREAEVSACGWCPIRFEVTVCEAPSTTACTVPTTESSTNDHAD